MQTVTFPEAGLEFNINQVAIEIGSIGIYWYAILIVLGFIIGLIGLKLQKDKYGIKFESIIDFMLYLVPISIISARIYYVIFEHENFNNIWQIFNIRTGGMAIYGGIIGGVITSIIYCKKKKINVLDLTDRIASFLALGQALGRWGNFTNVEAYGSKTYLPWRMGIIEAGKYIEVHPTFLYESIVTASIFIILMIKGNKRKFKGELTFLYLTIYSFFRMLIEGLRTDSLMFFNVRISQILSGTIFVVFSTILVYCYIKKQKKQTDVNK